eukprot:607576-Pyramimonas_sp.AAC.1
MELSMGPRTPGWGEPHANVPLGPSVELLTGPRRAVLVGGIACDRRPWDVLLCSFLWGHGALLW